MKGFGTEGKGLSRVRKVAGGTSILQETQVVTPDRTAFAASVFRVTDGGKGVKVWRIDTLMYRDLGAFSGTLSADGLEASSDMGTQMGLKRVGEAYEATGSRGDSVVFTSTCTKAAKEVVLDTPNALAKGLAPALVGDWQVAGEWTLPGKDGKPATIQVTGTSKYEWALGGGALLHHYERTTPMGAVHALGILRPADDGSSMKVWWFDTMQVDPLLAEGAVTESAWHGKGKTADGGTMGLELSKKGDALEMRLELDGKPVGSETFTRKR